MDPALYNPQQHFFLQPELVLISPHTNFTQRARKEGENKARGRKRPVTECSGPEEPKATQLVCGRAGVRMPICWLQVQCWVRSMLPIMLVFPLVCELHTQYPTLSLLKELAQKEVNLLLPHPWHRLSNIKSASCRDEKLTTYLCSPVPSCLRSLKKSLNWAETCEWPPMCHPDTHTWSMDSRPNFPGCYKRNTERWGKRWKEREKEERRKEDRRNRERRDQERCWCVLCGGSKNTYPETFR